MDKQKKYLTLKRFCQGQGADLFGVADIAKIKNEFQISGRILEKFDKAICLGARLSSSILEEIEGHPTKLYFHHYRTTNALLDQSALKQATIYRKMAIWLCLSLPPRFWTGKIRRRTFRIRNSVF